MPVCRVTEGVKTLGSDICSGAEGACDMNGEKSISLFKAKETLPGQGRMWV